MNSSSSSKQVQIYVARYLNGTYAISNTNASAIALETTAERLDFRTIASEVLSSNYFSQTGADVSYLIDYDLFDNSGRSLIDISGHHKVFLVTPDSAYPKRLFPTYSERGPPWMAQIGDSLYLKLTKTLTPMQVYTVVLVPGR